MTSSSEGRSWRSLLSAEGIASFEGLVEAAQERIDSALEERGQIVPTGLVELSVGKYGLVVAGADEIDTEQWVDDIWETIRAGRSQISAACVYYTVVLPGGHSNAASVNIEVRGGVQLRVTMPYRILNGRPEFGTYSIAEVEPRVWLDHSS